MRPAQYRQRHDLRQRSTSDAERPVDRDRGHVRRTRLLPALRPGHPGRRRAGAEQEPHAEATTGGIRILFDTRAVVESFTPTWREPSGGHRMALAFECASPDQVDSQYTCLVDAGHVSQREPFDAFWGQRYAVVLDPDGNPVDFYCPLA
ncbi:VOC family protein [Gordonia sp. DT218]|uniref:VOC family protein n=1 Tax=Gordonia sp. DT218 TaxID=3416659 RepID=UPI003CE83A4E